MRRKTSGNTCARPISPTACSKTTPQSSTLASSHGVAFSTSSVASSPSPAVIGLLPVNHSEVWYYTLSADHLQSPGARLNGAALEFGPNDDLPHFAGVRSPPGSVELAPATITFLTIGDSGN